MMTYAEAKEIVNKNDPSRRRVDVDGRLWKAIRITYRADEAAKIANGELEADKATFLTPKEAKKLEKAVKSNLKRPIGMTVEQAQEVLRKRKTPSGKVITDDVFGQQANDVIYRMSEVLYYATNTEDHGMGGGLSKGERKALKLIAQNTQKMVDDFDKERHGVRKKSLGERLSGLFHRLMTPKQKFAFKKKKKTFSFDDPNLWQSVKFPYKDQILFSYRINTSLLTRAEKAEVKRNLDRLGIRYTERVATSGEWAGDETIRLADARSIDEFRLKVLHHAMQPGWRPAAMSREAYEELQKKLQDRSPIAEGRTPAKADPVPLKQTTPELPAENRPEGKKNEGAFSFKNERLWQPVKFATKDQVLFSYRINTSQLTPEQKAEVKEKLDKLGIKYTERRATSGEWAGDETIRLADEKSIDIFREMVLNQAKQPGWSPSAVSIEEYNGMRSKLHPKTLVTETAALAKEGSPSPKQDTPKLSDIARSGGR